MAPLHLLLIIVVVLLLLSLGDSWGGYFPGPARSYGYGGAGLLGVLLIIVIVVLLLR